MNETDGLQQLCRPYDLRPLVDEVMRGAGPKSRSDVIGAVMAKTGGKANPVLVGGAVDEWVRTREKGRPT